MRIISIHGEAIQYDGDLKEDDPSLQWFDTPKDTKVQHAIVALCEPGTILPRGCDRFMVLQRDKQVSN